MVLSCSVDELWTSSWTSGAAAVGRDLRLAPSDTRSRWTAWWASLPALDVLLQRHHHRQVLIHVRLTGRLALPPQRVVHQLQLALPRQDVRVAVVEAQWDLRPGVGAAVAPDHSDLRAAGRKTRRMNQRGDRRDFGSVVLRPLGGELPTFMKRQTGGGSRSCRMREWVLMSVATTSLRPSTSSPSVQMSMDREARSPQVGIRASVSRTGRPKSSVTKRRAPGKKAEAGNRKKSRLSELTGLAFWAFLCAARLTGPGSIMEPGNRWASSALKAADTASFGGVRGGVMKSGVVLGVGGMTSEGWMKKPGAEDALEGTELCMGPTPEAVAAAEVVWCSLASSLAFCSQHRQEGSLETLDWE
ncbi:hypothetical protein EYF80_048345 [Liparis tanakae]|uniref:Uncharacterized protein n=1 Tax=Liparis tanakae TaxID=230148 RepID=A0A4Z2FJT5_9TELE|nr:hypothetical protein EYF80_048345 [Liparis tanakae]